MRLGARQHSPVDSVVSYVFLFGALEGSRAAAGIPIKPGRHRQVAGLSKDVNKSSVRSGCFIKPQETQQDRRMHLC